MSLLDKFKSMPPGANFSIFLRDMAEALDGIAANIKALPAYNPATAPAMLPTDTGSWTKAINSANGWGDVLNRMRGMAEAVDNINEWIERQAVITLKFSATNQNTADALSPEEVTNRLQQATEPARRPGRPPKVKAA